MMARVPAKLLSKVKKHLKGDQKMFKREISEDERLKLEISERKKPKKRK